RGGRGAARGPLDADAAGGGARKGADLVPFLAARHRAVDDAVDEMFGSTLTRSRAVRATDAAGWNSGRPPAARASIRNHTQVAAYRCPIRCPPPTWTSPPRWSGGCSPGSTPTWPGR